MGKLIYIDSKGSEHDLLEMNPGHLNNAVLKAEREDDPIQYPLKAAWQHMENQAAKVNLPSEDKRDGSEL